MTRQRLDIHRLTGLAGTGPDRTSNLERLLREERQALQAATDTWEHHIVSANVETLEEAIAKSQHNDQARAEREAHLAETRRQEAAAAEVRRQAGADAEVASLRRQFKAANPNASDAEVEAGSAALLEQQRQARTERTMATMRSRYAI